MQRKPLRKVLPKAPNDPFRSTPCCMMEGPSKTIKRSNKQNSQKSFFMENECEVLKLKGKDIEVSVNGLKQELLELEDNKKVLEKECLSIQKEIQNLEDGNVPQLKTSILKLELAQKNKAGEIREWEGKVIAIKKEIEQDSFTYQEQTSKLSTLEVDKWRAHSQNQGMKVVKANLEGEIQQLTEERNRLNLNHIEYEPEQEKMNQNIQNTVKEVNKCKEEMRQKLGILTSQALTKITSKIYKRIMGEALSSCMVIADDKRLKKKTLYSLMCIHQKYLDTVKSKYLERFKRLVNHRQEEARLVSAIRLLRNNNSKFKTMSLWKKEFMKIQYSQLRKQQTLSSLVQILEGVQGSLLYGGFNVWKGWSSRMRIGGEKLRGLVTLFDKKRVRKGFCSVYLASRHKLSEEREQDLFYKKSGMTLLRKYLKAWSHYMEQRRTTSTATKFRVFNILKQNQKETKRNKYLEMIHLIIKKNNVTKLLMKSFYALQISTRQELIHERSTKGDQIETVIETESTSNIKEINKRRAKCREIALSRLQGYITGIFRGSFDRITEYYSYSLKVSAFQLTLKRMVQIQQLAFSFRSLLLASTFSMHTNTKLEIDTRTSEIRSRVAELNTMKNEEKRIREESVQTGNIYIINWLEGIYRKLMINSIVRIGNHGTKRVLLFLSIKRLGTITKRLLSKESFLELKEFSQNRSVEISRKMMVDTFRERRNGVIKRVLISQLLKGVSKNQQLRKVVKHALKVLRHQLMSSGFESVRTLSIHRNNKSLRLMEQKLSKELIMLEEQGKSKQQHSLTRISQLKSQISRVMGYRQRQSINNLNRVIRNPASSALKVWLHALKKYRNSKAFLVKMNDLLHRITLKRGFELLLINFQRLVSGEQISKYHSIVKEFQENTRKAECYAEQLQQQIGTLKDKSLAGEEEANGLQKIIHNFQAIKLGQFNNYRNQRFLRAVIREWRGHTKAVQHRLSNVVTLILTNQCRDPFDTLCHHFKQQKKMLLLKQKLSISTQNTQSTILKRVLVHWRQWKNASIKQQIQREIQVGTQQQSTLEKKTQILERRYQNQIVKLLHTNFKQRFFSKLLQRVNISKIQTLQTDNTRTSYQRIICRQALVKLSLHSKSSTHESKCHSSIQSTALRNILSKSFSGWKSHHTKLQKFNRVFLRQYLSYNIRAYQNDFFNNVKLIAQENRVNKVEKSRGIIERLVRFYNNSGVMNLQRGFLKWKLNSKTILTRQNLLKRLFNKAHTNRIFHAWNLWKIEANARHIQHYHQTEGEIKIKQREFQRIRRHINQFKQMKGLVVFRGDQLISSPRYQHKQQVETISHNNKKYQLLSKLVLLQNQQLDKIHLWNSLRYFSELSEEMREKSLFVHNMMRNSQKYQGFTRWKRVIQSHKQRLQGIDKNQLIDQIKSIEEKVEILHSSKHQLKQEMVEQVKRTQFTHKFLRAKEGLSKILVFRAGQRRQRQAISLWHSISREIAAKEAQTVELMAIRRIQELTEELECLEYSLSLSLNLNEELRGTAMEGIEIAETLKYLTNQRDELNEQIKEQSLTCEALEEENIALQERFNLAQKQACQLLALARD